MTADIVVVGAGIAGLSAASALRAAGREVLVLERSRGVGGRCATRRVQGQPVDHGVPFVHGSNPDFLALVRAVPARRLEGWPRTVQGEGSPCHPDMFSFGEQRLAFEEGMTSLPKHLASGLDVQLQSRVVSIAVEDGGVRLSLDDDRQVSAPTVLVAIPAEQCRALLPDHPQLDTARHMLGWFSTVPCLAMAVGYELERPAPDFDLIHAGLGGVFTVISHDSAKRAERRFHVLVYQATPQWSRERLDQDLRAWSAEMLAEAQRMFGDWAGQPLWTSPQRWVHARVDGGMGLAGPLVVTFDEGARIGLAGEAYDPRGGLEGAWRSGQRAARRLLGAS